MVNPYKVELEEQVLVNSVAVAGSITVDVPVNSETVCVPGVRVEVAVLVYLAISSV